MNLFSKYNNLNYLDYVFGDSPPNKLSMFEDKYSKFMIQGFKYLCSDVVQSIEQLSLAYLIGCLGNIMIKNNKNLQQYNYEFNKNVNGKKYRLLN